MAGTPADIRIDTICDWGVEVTSASPETASTASSSPSGKCQGKVRFIHVRHEEAAAFMACAYVKSRRQGHEDGFCPTRFGSLKSVSLSGDRL